MARPAVYLLIVLSFFDLAFSRTDDNAFIYPTASGPALVYVGNLDFELGSTQTVQWVTNLTSYKIEMWQQGIATKIGYAVETVFSMCCSKQSFAGRGLPADARQPPMEMVTESRASNGMSRLTPRT